MKKLYVLAAFMLISAFAYSQWNWQNPLPTGNSLLAVCFTDASTGYSVGGYGDIIKTSDGGLTWKTVSVASGADLWSVSFPSADTGFVSGAYGTVLQTTDAGASWNDVSPSGSADL